MTSKGKRVSFWDNKVIVTQVFILSEHTELYMCIFLYLNYCSIKRKRIEELKELKESDRYSRQAEKIQLTYMPKKNNWRKTNTLKLKKSFTKAGFIFGVFENHKAASEIGRQSELRKKVVRDEVKSMRRQSI